MEDENIKFSSGKSKIMVVGKSEAEWVWKLVSRMSRVNEQVEEEKKEGRIQDFWNGGTAPWT